MHNELVVILSKLDKLTDMAADDDPDHSHHNMPVSRKTCSVSMSSPEINLRKKSKHYLSSTSFAAADVQRRKSKDKVSKCPLKREMSDWYHKNTYAREEFLRLAKELNSKISDMIQNLSIQNEASSTATSVQIATVADEIISTFKPQEKDTTATGGQVISVFKGHRMYPASFSRKVSCDNVPSNLPQSAPVLLSPSDAYKR
uniref:Uncharacterized protein n=1 Tax=Romanomermis culicivorax TaxID=13658 RepID=A0A915I572_ROMCU